jgi:hypothetical protein
MNWVCLERYQSRQAKLGPVLSLLFVFSAAVIALTIHHDDRLQLDGGVVYDSGDLPNDRENDHLGGSNAITKAPRL